MKPRQPHMLEGAYLSELSLVVIWLIRAIRGFDYLRYEGPQVVGSSFYLREGSFEKEGMLRKVKKFS